MDKDKFKKHFIMLSKEFSFKFKVKTKFGLTIRKRYKLNLNQFNNDIMYLMYHKIIFYIRKIELLDTVFIDNYKNVIITILDNIVAISTLPQNYEDNYNTLKTAINDAELVFKTMYKTCLKDMEQAVGSSLILDNYKQTINICTQMFNDLNKLT